MIYRLLNRGVLRLSDNVIVTRGMPEWDDYRQWRKNGGMAEPMVAPTAIPPTLAEIKRQRANLITTEALAHIQAVLPEVSNMAVAQLVRELWLSIAPAARSPTAKMVQVIAIYAAWGSALAEIKSCATPACVEAINVPWP